MEDRILVQSIDFDVAAEIASIKARAKDAGAVVSFAGLCRGEGGRLTGLELETYLEMAESEIGRIADEAHRRWSPLAVTIIHRFGRMRPGDNIVLVVTASEHRGPAFAAAEYLMDYLKTRAPFWKKEIGCDGPGAWVDARHTDEISATRWQTTTPID